MKSKQVLNDFFNNSDDENEEEDENDDEKEIQTLRQYNMIDNYHKGNKQEVPYKNSALGTNINHNNLFVSQNQNNNNHIDVSLQNIQHASKMYIGSMNNPDLFIASCNNSLISQQPPVDDYPEVPEIQLNYQHSHKQAQQAPKIYSIKGKGENQQQGMKKDVSVKVKQEDGDIDPFRGNENIVNSDDEDQYQQENDNKNTKCYNDQKGSKQQLETGSKVYTPQNNYIQKEDIIRLSTHNNKNNIDFNVKSDFINNSVKPVAQKGVEFSQQRDIKLMKVDNKYNKNPIYKLPQSHKDIMKKEISLNFIGLILFGIYLLVKSIWFEDSTNQTNESQIILYIIAIFLVVLGIFGLSVIFIGMRNTQLEQSPINSMSTKIINSAKEKSHNNSDNLSKQQNKKQEKYQQQTQSQQQLQSPEKIQQQQLLISNLSQQQQAKSLQMQISQNDFQQQIITETIQDVKKKMTGVILISVLSFTILIESIRLLKDIKSIIFLFFIYHQFIIFYKLSASRFSNNVTNWISFILLFYAITRYNLLFFFNSYNKDEENNSSKKECYYNNNKFIPENIVMDVIFFIIIIFQILPLRFLAISPFICNLQCGNTLRQEQILVRSGIYSDFNIDGKNTELNQELKINQFMKKITNNRTNNINKNISFSKQNTLKNGDNINQNVDYTKIQSNEAERLKSNHIKKMYQDILNVIPEGVALINSSTKLVYANKTLSKILQCSKKQIVKTLLNLATKSKAEYDTTSQRGGFQQNILTSPQYSKVFSMNQQMQHPRLASQSQYKSFNSLNTPNHINNTNNATSINQLTTTNNINNNNNGQQDVNNNLTPKTNTHGMLNNQHGNTSNTYQEQYFSSRKVSQEMFDTKRKASTAKPSIFHRNHLNSFSKEESPNVYTNMNSMGNNGNITSNLYHQSTQCNTKNAQTANTATPINLNTNSQLGDNRKGSAPYVFQYQKSSQFEQTTYLNANHPVDDLLDKNTYQQIILNSAGNGFQNNINNHQMFIQNQMKQTNEFSDVMSLTNYIQMCPLGCQPNCIHSQAVFKETVDGQSLNDQLHSQNLNQIMNASSNPNQLVKNGGDEDLFLKQRSKTFKKSEIIRKDISVKDIISSIFENIKQYQQDQDTKTAKTFRLKDKNSDIASYTHKTRKKSNSIQESIVSQMQNQQYIGYFQYIDDMIKVEVEYKNSTLVLSMVMCEFVTNGFVEQFALILVNPLWQEMYEKKLEDMSKYRMKMFASLSHELRTPLNCSISMLQQLMNIIKEDSQIDKKQQQENLSIKDKIRNKLFYQNPNQIQSQESNQSNKIVKSEENSLLIKLTDKMKDYIETYINPALNSNNLLLNLINDILDFVQIDSGKFKFSFIKFDLELLLTTCISLVGIQGKQNDRNVDLILKYDERCPKIINSDPNRIRQVILNFLSNAMKYTTQGQIVLSATLINSKDRQVVYQTDQQSLLSDYQIDDELMNNSNHIVEVAVEDQGIGISPENIDKIFTIFNKIDLGENQTLNSQGCGLGLTISNSIAKGLGPINKGGIRVQSEIGQGSVFSILIEDREEDLQEHKINYKEEAIRKMETINSLVDSPISQQTKLRQFSSFGQVEQQYSKQPSIQYLGRNHSMKVEDSPQVRTIRINSTFTNKTNKTSKTIKTNQKNVGGSGFNGQTAYEDSCIVCDSEINRNSFQNFTPSTPFQIKEQEIAVFDDLSSSSSNQSDINRDDMQIKSQNQQFLNNQKPLYKSTTIHSKTTYKTKNFKTIQKENKDLVDGYISYNSTQTQAHLKKRDSSSPTNSFLKTPTSSNENPLQLYLSPLDAEAKARQNKKRKLLACSGQKQSQSSSSSLQQKKKDLPTVASSTGLKQVATTATTVIIAPSQQETNTDNFEKQSQEVSIINDLNINKKKNDFDYQCDSQQLMLDNSGDRNLNSLKLQNIKNSSIFNNTSIEAKSQNRKSQKVCECPQILVVDDNGFNMHAITLQLKTYGFRIDQAYNGQEAVDKIEKRYYENSCCKTYKLIFMDIEMPIKNGYEATQDIRNFFNGNSFITKQPIIVACTAYVSDEDKQKALMNGMDDFIKKPVFQEGLDLLLNQWYNVIFDENDDFEDYSEDLEDYSNGASSAL